jgi:tetratricopeptide (TPR) repeat protein
VYALGVILFQLLANRLPLELDGKSLAQCARIIADEVIPMLGTFNSAFRGDIETIAAKAMEKDRERRYQSAADLAADIRRHLSHEPLMARPATRMYQLRKFARRNKALVSGAASVFAALAIGLVVSWRQKVQADRASALADSQRLLAQARLADAESVRDFLRDMLTAVDPRADGRDVRVIEVLERASDRIDHGFENQPAIEASLHDAVGNAYLSLALHDRAEPHLTRSLALNRGLHNGDHIDTARALQSVGSLRLAQGNLPAARSLFDEALAMRERLFDGPHRSVAESLNSLNLVCRDTGDLVQAEVFARRAIDMMIDVVGPDDLQITAYYDDLARLMFTQGKYDDAASLHDKSLKIRRHALGEHADVALSLNHFAQTQFVKGDYAGAEQSLREALAINRKVMGEQHTAVADTLSNLAVLSRAQRNLDEAERLVRQALDMRRSLLGDDHQNVATTLNELANIVRDKGDPQSAEPLYRQALETFRRSAGGADNAYTAVSLNNLADVLANLKRTDESERAYREAVEIRREKLPPGHPQLAESLLGLGVLLTRTQRAAEAEAPLREALEVRRAAFGPDSPQAALAEHALGVCLVALTQYQNAEDALLHSLKVLQAERGPEHPQTSLVRQHLVDLYTAWGKPERIAGIQPATAPANTSPQSDHGR